MTAHAHRVVAAAADAVRRLSRRGRDSTLMCRSRAPACSSPSLGAQCTPDTASRPSAAVIESGTAREPSRLALAIDGSAPAPRAARSHSSHASEPVANKFGPKLRPTSEREGVIGAPRRQQRCGGQVVNEHRPDRADRRGAPQVEVSEEIGRPGPHPSKRPERHCHAEEPDQHRDAEHVSHMPRAFASCRQAHANGTYADGGHRDGRVVEGHNEDRRGHHGGEAEAEHGTLARGEVPDSDPQRSVLDAANDGGRHEQSGQGGRPHVGEELSAAEMEVTEDDQVGEVGARQEQRPRIREEQAAVEEGGLAFASASRRIDEDRCQESDRGVEVQ